MAVKSANVLARVEPDVKEQAESIMAQIGVPASVVINMLYKQIILTRRIPFDLCAPSLPTAREEMSAAEFNSIMQRGYDEDQANNSTPADDVFSGLRQKLNEK